MTDNLERRIENIEAVQRVTSSDTRKKPDREDAPNSGNCGC